MPLPKDGWNKTLIKATKTEIEILPNI